jgi:uncharacterized delta-60 repeat protein
LTTAFSGSSSPSEVAVQADGKIVAAGARQGSPGAFALARYNTNGSLDPSFDGDGKVTTTFEDDAGASSLAIQADGRIVAAGHSRQIRGSVPINQFALVRYSAAGSLDSSFDGDGRVVNADLGSITGLSQGAHDVAVQTDGKILATGIDAETDFALARYNPNGSLDTGFDGDGVATNGSFEPHGLAIQTDSRIVVAGIDRHAGNGFALARYKPNGSLDPGFGGDGKVATDFEDDAGAGSVALQADGKIVAAGSISPTNGTTDSVDFAVARYLDVEPTAGTGTFTPVEPTRILNTFTGVGVAAAGTVGPGQTLVVDVTNPPSVPADATAVVLNVTVTGANVPATPTGGFSYLSVTPNGGNATSNLNFKGANVGGQDIAASVKVPVGEDGNVRIYNDQGQTHVIAAVFGYYANTVGGGRYTPVTPQRVLQLTQVGAGQTIGVDVTTGEVPADATAVVLNITVSGATAPSYLSVTPNGGNNTSNLNFKGAAQGGQDIANLVVVPVGDDGSVRVYNDQGGPFVIVDVFGYYRTEGGSRFTPLPPARLLQPTPVGAGQTISLDVATGAVPTTATAVVLNLTVSGAEVPASPTQGLSYLSLTPEGGNTTSNVNFRSVAAGGQDIANLVVVPVGADGKVCIYNDKGSAYVIADVFGFFGPATGELPPPPVELHVAYAVPSDMAHDPSLPAAIRHEVGLVQDWLAGQTGGRRLRSRMAGGQLLVSMPTLGMTKSEVESAPYLDTSAVEDELRRLGYGQGVEHLAVFIPVNWGACGQSSGRMAFMFMNACNIYPSAGTRSWPYGSTYLFAHEVIHGLGAVPGCAPHAEPGGHVVDDNRDLLYQGPSQRDWDNLKLDPGRDDYYGHGRPDCLDIATHPIWVR